MASVSLAAGIATGWCLWDEALLTLSFTPGCPPFQLWVSEPGLLSPPCGTSWDGKQGLEAALLPFQLPALTSTVPGAGWVGWAPSCGGLCTAPTCLSLSLQERGDQDEIRREDFLFVCKSEGGECFPFPWDFLGTGWSFLQWILQERGSSITLALQGRDMGTVTAAAAPWQCWGHLPAPAGAQIWALGLTAPLSPRPGHSGVSARTPHSSWPSGLFPRCLFIPSSLKVSQNTSGWSWLPQEPSAGNF